MKSKRSLMRVLVGLAMLATPITATAYDNDKHAHDDSRAAHVSRSSKPPARSFAPARNVAPPVVTPHEFHNNALAPNRAWRDANEYRNYGNPGYYRAPAYSVVAPYSGGPGYAGGAACRQARGIANTYYHDRNTGHPAAAAYVLAHNQWAFRSGCAGVR
jgi:hypothetical protein